MKSPNSFGSKKVYFWTNYIIYVFGLKTQLHYFSNIFLYTKHKNNKIKAKI